MSRKCTKHAKLIVFWRKTLIPLISIGITVIAGCAAPNRPIKDRDSPKKPKRLHAQAKSLVKKSSDKRKALAFEISIKQAKNYKSFSIQNGDLHIKNDSGMGVLKLFRNDKCFRIYPYLRGDKPSYAATAVTRDDESVKKVEMISEPFGKWIKKRLKITITARRGFPGFEIRSWLINLSDEPTKCAYSWCLQMSSSKYVTKKGGFKAEKQWMRIEFDKWIFLPSIEESQRYVIIFNPQADGAKFSTSHKSGGKAIKGLFKGSWLIMRNAGILRKNEANVIDFAISPAANSKEAALICTQFMKTNQRFFKNNNLN